MEDSLDEINAFYFKGIAGEDNFFSRLLWQSCYKYSTDAQRRLNETLRKRTEGQSVSLPISFLERQMEK